MKIYHWLLPALSLFPASAAAQMAGYEYWTDGNDTQRTYVEQTQGSVGIEIDVADLRPGIHRFHFRACDAQGRWSSPFCRYFLRFGKAYDGTGMATCEYAIDGGEWAEAALVDGRLDLELPVSGLVPGVHRLMLRFADEAGRWTGIMTRNFVCLGPDYSSNTLRSYECWIDGDYAARVEGAAEGGMVELELSTSDLSYGLHRVSFRSRDEAGRWSAPFSRYFVKAEPSLADNRIEAYEYWFNNGKTTRVEVTPANPFAADDIEVDVEGVVPHEVPENYTVDWETCTAYCPDDVVFGMRFGDTSGRWTEARTDTFAYDVPVALDFRSLVYGDSAMVVQPEEGRIYAYEVTAQAGDSLVWGANAPCRMDIYDESGTRLYRLGQSIGAMEQKMEAETNGKLYALAYGARVDTLSLWCHKLVPTRVSWVESGIKVSVSEGHIRVVQAEGWDCSVYHTQGYVLERRKGLKVSEDFVLPRGIYVVSLTAKDGNTYKKKVIVP